MFGVQTDNFTNHNSDGGSKQKRIVRVKCREIRATRSHTRS